MENEKRWFNKKYMKVIIVVGIIVVLAVCFSKHSNAYTENTYELSELDTGVYAYYYEVSSNVPAKNYSNVTFCIGNEVCKHSGEVNISYTDDKPKVKIRGSVVWLSVPRGTIVYQENVGLK